MPLLRVFAGGVDMQLFVDAANVSADHRHADVESSRSVIIGESAGKQPQYAIFARGQF